MGYKQAGLNQTSQFTLWMETGDGGSRIEHPSVRTGTGGRLVRARLQHLPVNAEVSQGMPDWAAACTNLCKTQGEWWVR